MSYTLQAIIGDASVLRAGRHSNAVVVDLPQCKGMIPLTNRLFDDNIPFLPLTGGGGPTSLEPIDEFVLPFLGKGKLIYVEAEFFGGEGTQASVTYDENGRSTAPLVDPDAINSALRFLGVQVGDSHDEFDALGLGKFRKTEDWEGDVTT